MQARTLLALLGACALACADDAANPGDTDTDAVDTDAVDTDDTDAGETDVETDVESAPDSDTDVATDACAALPGVTFGSTEEHECGLGPDGVVLCTWTIAFTDDGWTWMHSDVGEVGTYTCAGGAITASTGGAGGYEGTIADGLLTWDGLTYEALRAR